MAILLTAAVALVSSFQLFVVLLLGCMGYLRLSGVGNLEAILVWPTRPPKEKLIWLNIMYIETRLVLKRTNSRLGG